VRKERVKHVLKKESRDELKNIGIRVVVEEDISLGWFLDFSTG